MSGSNCIKNTKSSNITVKENGRSLNVENPEQKEYTKIKIDGCLISQEPAADYCIIDSEKNGIVVELKGKNVPRALVQIENSSIWLRQNGYIEREIAGWIICNQVPKFLPSFQPKLSKLKKIIRGPVHISSHNVSAPFPSFFEFRKSVS